MQIRQALGALVAFAIFATSGCGSGLSPNGLTTSKGIQGRFRTSALAPIKNPAKILIPNKQAPGTKIKTSEPTGPNIPQTSAVTFLSSPSMYAGMRYNFQVDYVDGTSVIGNIVDGNTLVVIHPDGTWDSWSLQFTLGTDSNVYLTAMKLSGMQTGASPTPAPLFAPIPHAYGQAGGGGGTCTTNCRPVENFSRAAQSYNPCTASSTVAGAVGSVVGAIAAEQTIALTTAVVGTVIGPEGTAAGYWLGQYAAAALGVSTLGGLVGMTVFTVAADALCQAATSDPNDNGPIHIPPQVENPWPNPSGAGGGLVYNGTPQGTSGTTTVTVTSPGGTVTISCCYPLPTPGPGQSTPAPKVPN